MFRTTRPATRRYDRLTADLATIAGDLAARLAEAEEVMRKARGDYERLEMELRALAPSGAATSGSAVWTEIPDGYYWAFEQRMRGAAGSIVDRLRGYEDLVVPLREAVGTTDDRRPRWVDLGCGQGEFCALLGEWGWDVEGVDASPDAVEACRARGIEVTLADVLTYLETRPDDPVRGVSAIQLIEHLRGGPGSTSSRRSTVRSHPAGHSSSRRSTVRIPRRSPTTSSRTLPIRGRGIRRRCG